MICPKCGAVFCDDSNDYPPDRPATPRRFCSDRCKHGSSHGDSSGRRYRKRQQLACARRGKKGYETRKRAADDAEAALRKSGLVLYPYECACGFWHLSRQRPENNAMARELRAALFGGKS